MHVGDGIRHGWQLAYRKIECRTDFTRQPDDAEAVGPVGGHLEIDHRIAIEALD